MNLQSQPSINEIISFLEDYSIEDLLQLRGKYPHRSQMLQSGITLGEEFENDPINELKIRGEVCNVWLTTSLQKCDLLLPKLKSKLIRLKNIQLISQIIIAISGASLLITLQNEDENEKLVTYIIGFFTLIGSLLTIWVQSKSFSLAPNSNSLFQVYERLVDIKIEGEQLKNEFEVLLKLDSEKSINRLTSIIEKSNSTSVELRKIVERIL